MKIKFKVGDLVYDAFHEGIVEDIIKSQGQILIKTKNGTYFWVHQSQLKLKADNPIE